MCEGSPAETKSATFNVSKADTRQRGSKDGQRKKSSFTQEIRDQNYYASG